MKPKDFKRQLPPPEPASSEEVKQEEVTVIKEPKVESEVKEEPVSVEGEVCNVNRFLNVRKHPKVEVNNIVGIIEKGMRIVVTDKKPVTNKDGEWYKIKVTKSGLEGYAMKKYIKIL